MERDIFQIELRREPSAMLLRLAGDLDLAAQEPLRRLVDLLALQGTQSVLIDASDAEFIDASVVGTLFQLAREVCDKGGAIALVDAREASRLIWGLTGWSELCPPLPACPVTNVPAA
jgi:anti-anti-sigma factor